MRFIIRVVVNAFALWVVTLIPALQVQITAFPLYIITLGLIGFVINGFLLWLTAWITSGFGWGLTVGDFWWGVVAALIISLINGVFGFILRPQSKKPRRD